MTLSHPHRLLLLPALAALFLWLGLVGGADNPTDVAIVQALSVWRHSYPALTSGVIALTWLGSAYTTLGLVALAALWLWRKRQRQPALFLAATVLGGRLAADGIKLLYDRARPAFDLHPVVTSSSSYPSGHAANSMTAFVAVALLAAPAMIRGPALAVAIPLAIAVGLSRPFLGVHWPSDTLGGWSLAAMVLVTLSALRPDEAQHQVVGGHDAPRIEG